MGVLHGKYGFGQKNNSISIIYIYQISGKGGFPRPLVILRRSRRISCRCNPLEHEILRYAQDDRLYCVLSLKLYADTAKRQSISSGFWCAEQGEWTQARKRMQIRRKTATQYCGKRPQKCFAWILQGFFRKTRRRLEGVCRYAERLQRSIAEKDCKIQGT